MNLDITKIKLDYFPFLKKLQLNIIKRQNKRFFKRYDCSIDADINTINRNIHYKARVLNLSLGGALVRPASLYILDRFNEAIILNFGFISVNGFIASSTSRGYGISFDKPLDEAALQAILDLSG